MSATRTLLVALALLAGCARSPGTAAVSPADPAPELTWVAKGFTAGRQCAHEAFRVPGTRSELGQAGIAVHDTRVVPGVVCEACDCPAYSAIHYALIPASGLGRARRLGWEARIPESR